MTLSIHQSVEHEIKFHIPPRFQLPRELGETAAPRVFTSTYFDTPDHRLGRAGLTLRKRVERSKGVWQLKIPSGDVRLELKIDSGSRVVPREFQDLLLSFFRHQEPVPIGKLRTKRNTIRLYDGQEVIAEIVQDTVALLKDKKIISTFHELEIELQRDHVPQLKSLCKLLVDAGAQEIALQPKIFQALQLPFPLKFFGRGASAPPNEHIQERLHAQFMQMVRHDPGTRLGQDREALHQMRVATRRLRTTLRHSKTFLDPDWAGPHRRELKWIGSLLGDVRDWDVLLDLCRTTFSDFSDSEQEAFHRILNHFEGQRDSARTILLEALRSERYLTFLGAFESALTHLPFQDSPCTLQDVVHKAYEKLQGYVRSTHCLFPSSDLHRTRILAKRARYAYELAEPTYGKPPKNFLQVIKTFQDQLGQHHDDMVAEHRLLELKQQTSDTDLAYVTGLMVERLRTRQHDVHQEVPGQWKKLKKQGKKL